jgi:hypothetical protein
MRRQAAEHWCDEAIVTDIRLLMSMCLRLAASVKDDIAPPTGD